MIPIIGFTQFVPLSVNTNTGVVKQDITKPGTNIYFGTLVISNFFTTTDTNGTPTSTASMITNVLVTVVLDTTNGLSFATTGNTSIATISFAPASAGGDHSYATNADIANVSSNAIAVSNLFVTATNGLQTQITARLTNYAHTVTFQDQFTVLSTNTTEISSFGLMPNGINLGGLLAADKWITWANGTVTNFAIGTYRGENNYWYLYNVPSEQVMLTVSQGGQIGINHPPNLINYHSLWSKTGVDDLDFGGTNTVAQTYRALVSIVATGIAGTAWCDTWNWKFSYDMGNTYFYTSATYNVGITNCMLTNGVFVTFGNTNGHTAGQNWQKVLWSQLPNASLEARPRIAPEILLANNIYVAGGTDTYTDVTYDCSSGTALNDVLSTTNKAILIGSKTPINTFFFNVVSPLVGGTVIGEYYDGANWITMNNANSYVDRTTNLTTYGEILHETATESPALYCPTGRTASAYTLLWYRFRTTTQPTAPATLGVITPHGEKRLAIYCSQFAPEPCFWVGGRGNTYVQRAYQQDTTSAFQANQLVTESRVEKLIKDSQGTYYYPQTNFAFANPVDRGTMLQPQTTAWTFTNAVTANSTNYGNIFVITNSQIGATSVPAGTRYSFANVVSAYGVGGFASVEKWFLVEWNNGYTNILGESETSLAIPNSAGTRNNLILLLTTATNNTVASTNYYGILPALVTSGGKAGTFLRYYGGTYASYIIQGAVSSVGGSGVTKAVAGNGISVSPVSGLGDVTFSLASGSGGGMTASTNNYFPATNTFMNLWANQLSWTNAEVFAATNVGWYDTNLYSCLYEMSAVTGMVVHDTSGNAKSVTNQTAVQAVKTVLGTNKNGRVESYENFDGTNFFRGPVTLNGLTNCTWFAWLKPVNGISAYGTAISEFYSAQGSAGLRLNNTAARFVIEVCANGQDVTLQAGSDLSYGDWVFVWARYRSGSNLELYTNGVLTGTPVAFPYTLKTDGGMGIGWYGMATYYWKGGIYGAGVLPQYADTNTMMQIQLNTMPPTNNIRYRVGDAAITNSYTDTVIHGEPSGSLLTNGIIVLGTNTAAMRLDALGLVQASVTYADVARIATNATTANVSSNVTSAATNAIGSLLLSSNNVWTGTNTFSGTKVVISSNLVVGGVISGFTNAIGNGSGLTNLYETVVFPSMSYPGNGATFNQNFGPMMIAPYSDTDAYFMFGFHLRKGGTFSIVMTWQGSLNNTSKTMSGKLYLKNMASGTAGATWNIAAGDNWDIAIPDTADNYNVSTIGSYVLSDNSFVGVQYIKDDNAGGASGNVMVHSIVLVRQ